MTAHNILFSLRGHTPLIRQKNFTGRACTDYRFATVLVHKSFGRIIKLSLSLGKDVSKEELMAKVL